MTNYSFEGVFDLDEALSMPILGNSYSNIDVDSPLAHEESMTIISPCVVTSKGILCVVCTETFDQPQHGAAQIPCGHVYHAHCIATWLSVRNS